MQEGHSDEAKKWYEQAVQLDSQSFLAHYYYAVISMRDAHEASGQDQVESSLRAAIKLNPLFAPAFDSLGVLLAMRHKNLDEARMMGVTAVSLDPSNIGYRINVANILMTMEQSQNAIVVLQAAAKVAKTPEESQMVADALHACAGVCREAQSQFAEQQITGTVRIRAVMMGLRPKAPCPAKAPGSVRGERAAPFRRRGSEERHCENPGSRSDGLGQREASPLARRQLLQDSVQYSRISTGPRPQSLHRPGKPASQGGVC